MSQFFRKGGIALNDTEWIQDFADRRLQYGVSQTKLAVMAGISREHLSRIESGKVADLQLAFLHNNTIKYRILSSYERKFFLNK